MRPTRSEGEPHDRLTRLCDTMSKALEADPEYREDDKAIILLDSRKRGGLVSHGYEDDAELLIRLLSHARAVARANGKEIQLHTIGSG